VSGNSGGCDASAHSPARSYLFVPNPVLLRGQLLSMAASLLMAPFLLLLLFREDVVAIMNGEFSVRHYVVILLSLIGAMAGPAFRFFRRKRIVVDEHGITFKGFFQVEIPPHIGWEELAMVRVTEGGTSRRKGGCQSLMFCFLFGAVRLFPVTQGEQELYCGEGHSLSLRRAIGVFAGPVEPLNADEQKMASSLTLLDLGKEVGQIATAAAFIMLVAVLLFATELRALPDPMHKYFFWSVGGLAFLLAIWHMRSSENKAIMLFCAVLFAGTSAFVVLPCLAGLPLLLGEKSKQAFFIVEDNRHQQVWETRSSPPLRITVKAAPERRIHHGVETRLEMTVYRGPGRLASVLQTDYHALSHRRDD